MLDFLRRRSPSYQLDDLTAGWSMISKSDSNPFVVDESDTPPKIELGVGAYRDDDGKPFVLPSVRKAEEILMAENLDKEYLPITGHPQFVKAAVTLAYGTDFKPLDEKRIVAAQSISGTGAVRLGGVFLARHYPHSKTIYIPNPTWSNHGPVFRDSGLDIKPYRYFDHGTFQLDLDGMIQDLEDAPQRSIILLHACAHNPTGVDPTPEQWRMISAVVKRRGHLPFFDMAYQGFASGDLAHDARALRQFAHDGHYIVLAQSFAKNMGLYGERVGALSMITGSAGQAEVAERQLRLIIRAMYSNPPIHGARIAAKILTEPSLYAQWEVDLKGMADRILKVRKTLYDKLENEFHTPGEWGHITSQVGMFCFTGLTPSHVRVLAEKTTIFMGDDGRISLTGLNDHNIDYFVRCVDSAVRGTL